MARDILQPMELKLYSMTTKQQLAVLLVASSLCAVLQVHAGRHILSSPGNIKFEEQHVVDHDGHGDDGAMAADPVVGAAKECSFLIVTKTGDMLTAGSDSKFTFTFWDASNSTFSIVVDGDNGAMFEQGRFNKIGPLTKACMNPCRIKITTDGWGAAPAWYLEWLKVTVTAIGRSTYWHKFHVNTWIGPETGGSVEEVNINECYGGVTAA